MSGGAKRAAMAYDEYEVPLEVEHLQPPVLNRVPVSIPLDLDALLGAARRMVDLSSLRVLAGDRLLPAQFSPADDFDALRRQRGELVLLAPARLRGAVLRFGATDDLKAPRLPYPPRSYRHLLPDGKAARPAYFRRMQIIPQPEGRHDIEEDGKLVTSYHFRASEPRPYLFPVIGPAGRGLTRLGHPHDPGDTHLHHHSLWVGHFKVNGEDFWGERPGGRLRHQQFERTEDGPAFARLRDLVHWENPAGRKVLIERREVTVYPAEGGRLMDFHLEFTPAAGPVTFDQTSFGFLAVRVAKSMGVFDGGGLILNSEGGINEPGVFWKPARWCDYSGPVAQERDGTPVWNGIGFLDHPSNPSHPTAWHVRPDGWMGASFTQKEPYSLRPGGKLELRYRLYLHAGDAREARVEAAWHDYAHPPRTRLGPARPART